jgi:integrase
MATIRKRKQKYQVQVRRIGLRPVAASFHQLKDAQAWARYMELKADRRDLPPDPNALREITLGELVVRYRDTVSPRKRTAQTERVVLNAFLLHPICRRKLSDITRTDFAAYRDDRLKKIKASSLKRSLVPIHNLYELAKTEWGLPIRDNPVANLKLPPTDIRRERRLKESEWEKLMGAAHQSRNPILLSVIKFAVLTGLRRGELLAARWDDVDWQQRALVVRLTKNGHPRTLPLTTECLNLLNVLPKREERVFPISGNAVRLAWTRLCKRAGIANLHFHDLRHEAISRFFEKGLTVPEVALLSGHKDMRMLLRYSHAMRSRVLEKLDATHRTGGLLRTTAEL